MDKFTVERNTVEHDIVDKFITSTDIPFIDDNFSGKKTRSIIKHLLTNDNYYTLSLDQ